MIYEVIKNAIEAAPELSGKAYPSGVCVDDVDAPFAVYAFTGRTEVTDLAGNIHHYDDGVRIDLFAGTYDQVHELYRAVGEHLKALADRDDGAGEWIFGLQCSSKVPDGADLEINLMSRTMQVSVQWLDFAPNP